MTEKKSKGGGLIMVVIVALVGYVGYAMMAQPSSSGGPTGFPDSSAITGKTGVTVEAKENPYVAKLLAPKTGIGGATGSSATAASTTTSSSNTTATGSDDSEVSRLRRLIYSPNAQDYVFQDVVPADVRASMDSCKNHVEEAVKSGDTTSGIGKVNMGLIYYSSNPKLPASDRIDILIGGAKLAHQAKDFDKARGYVTEALTLSRKHGDYRIGTIEGLRAVLNGNEAGATAYNEALGQFNDAYERKDSATMQDMASKVLAAARNLPEDSSLRLYACVAQALVSKASEPAKTSLLIAKTQESAGKLGDDGLVALCQTVAAK